MSIVPALRWALATGRERDLAPVTTRAPNPAWLWWTVCGVVLCWWALRMFLVWDSVFGGAWFGLAAALLAVLDVAPLALCRYRPLTAARVALLAAALGTVLADVVPHPVGPVHRWPLDMYMLPLAPALVLALARCAPDRRDGIAITAVGIVLAGTFAHGTSVMIGPLLGVVVTIALGVSMGKAQWAEAETNTEREKRSALRERTRIARDLHDVIGHHLSMIAVRTDSASYRIPDLPEAARDELAEIGTAAREALDETRRLLGVLRDDEQGGPEHLPQPTIDDIPGLVDQVRQSGVDVTLTADGRQRPVPPSTGLSAYRILQEALSNARRHSPGAPVEVRLSYDGGMIVLAVDNGPGAVPATPSPDGTGLAGIAERVAMAGGTADWGPRADGGFRVAVTLPVPT